MNIMNANNQNSIFILHKKSNWIVVTINKKNQIIFN